MFQFNFIVCKQTDGHPVAGFEFLYAAIKYIKTQDSATYYLYDLKEGKECSCNKNEQSCGIHGISAQLNRSQME